MKMKQGTPRTATVAYVTLGFLLILMVAVILHRRSTSSPSPTAGRASTKTVLQGPPGKAADRIAASGGSPADDAAFLERERFSRWANDATDPDLRATRLNRSAIRATELVTLKGDYTMFEWIVGEVEPDSQVDIMLGFLPKAYSGLGLAYDLEEKLRVIAVMSQKDKPLADRVRDEVMSDAGAHSIRSNDTGVVAKLSPPDLRAFVSGAGRLSPERALELCESIPDDSLKSELRQRTMDYFLGRDSMAAGEFIANLEGGRRKDVLISHMVTWAYSKGDRESAENWLSEIESQEIRDSVAHAK